MAKVKVEQEPIKNIKNLRDFLASNLLKIESGDIPLQKSLELCRMGQVFINSLKLELEYHKCIKSKEKIDFFETKSE